MSESLSPDKAPAVGVTVIVTPEDSIGTQEEPLLRYEFTVKWLVMAAKEGFVIPDTVKAISVNVVGKHPEIVRIRTSGT